MTISVARRTRGGASIEVDTALVDSYIQAARRIQKRHRLAGELSLDTIMRLPEVVRPRDEEGPGAGRDAVVMKAFGRALAAHDAMRVREGKILERDILGRMKTIGRLRESMAKRAPEVVPAHRKRLIERLNEAAGLRVDEGRLAQEVALLAEKADITEELVRLAGYVEQTGEILGRAKEPVGKKLDFIMQEMNREANTINSKSVDLDLCRDALEVKAEVEKIREQVQNIE